MVTANYKKSGVTWLLNNFRLLHFKTCQLTHLGKGSGMAGYQIQITWGFKCLISSLCLQSSTRKRKITFGGILCGSCMGDQIREKWFSRTNCNQTYLRNYHVTCIREVGQVTPGPALEDQPVDKYCQVGVQTPHTLPADKGIPLARGSHRTRVKWRGWPNGANHAQPLPELLERDVGSAYSQGQEVREWKICRCVLHRVYWRLHPGTEQGNPSFNFTPPRPEFFQNVRD